MTTETNVASLESSLKATADENIALKRQISELESTIRAITDENEQVIYIASFDMSVGLICTTNQMTYSLIDIESFLKKNTY